MASNLKALIVGCGSIGRRHLRNLKALGIKNFILCDTNPDVLKTASEGLENPVLKTSFQEAVKEEPGVAVICTPSSMHVPMAVELAKKGVHILIEKPLSDSLDGMEELKYHVEKNGVVAMMAMCYRFHPVLKRLKELLDSSAIGKLYHVNYYGGQYLPDWHPYADYRKEYAARKALGGGVVLTTIHGLDDIRWLYGEAIEVKSFIDKVSDLEMDVEDLVTALIKTENNTYVMWQTDYLQRAKQHRMALTGSTGNLRCDLVEGVIEVYTVEAGKWTAEKLSYDINSMYVDEMSHFLDCVKNGTKPSVGLDEGIKTLRLALEVKQAGAGLELLRQ